MKKKIKKKTRHYIKKINLFTYKEEDDDEEVDWEEDIEADLPLCMKSIVWNRNRKVWVFFYLRDKDVFFYTALSICFSTTDNCENIVLILST